MKRWGLVFALLLSLGVNLGVLGMMAVHRLRPPEASEPSSRQGAGGSEEGSPGSPAGEATGQLPTDGTATRPPGSSTEPAVPGTPTGPLPNPTQPPGTPAGPVQGSDRTPGIPTGSVQGPGQPPGPSSAAGQTGGRPRDRSHAPGQGEERLPDRPPAGTEPYRPDAMPQMRLQRLADRLGLQGEVRERFIAQQREFFLATARDRMRLRGIHAELRRELASPEPDRARTEQLTQEASRAYLELERAMVANVLTTREMLDPEQERLFLEFVGRMGPGRFAAPREDGQRFPPRRRRFRRFRDRY